jgi:hypothetical protein
MMSVEQSVEWELEGETEVLGEILPQRHFAHHKSHMTWDQPRASAVGSRLLTAWAMARPGIRVYSEVTIRHNVRIEFSHDDINLLRTVRIWESESGPDCYDACYE